MRDFKKLLIWQKAMEVFTAVYKSVEKFPNEERYGLRSQVTRSAVSIAANIAEGSSKSSQKGEVKGILGLIGEEQKMLSSFIDKLKG